MDCGFEAHAEDLKEARLLRECAYTKKKHRDLEERYKNLTEKRPVAFTYVKKTAAPLSAKNIYSVETLRSLNKEKTQDSAELQIPNDVKTCISGETQPITQKPLSDDNEHEPLAYGEHPLRSESSNATGNELSNVAENDPHVREAIQGTSREALNVKEGESENQEKQAITGLPEDAETVTEGQEKDASRENLLIVLKDSGEGSEKDVSNEGVGVVYAKPIENKTGKTDKKNVTPWKKCILGVILAAVVLVAGCLIVDSMWPELWNSLVAPSATVTTEGENEETETSAGVSEAVDGSQATLIRTVAAVDKTQLIQDIKPDYSNIEVIAYNPDLKYREGVAYGIKGIEDSTVLTENIWYENGGNPVYYDESAVRTLAQFNDLWIDYINSGDRSVFQMINLEGKAAKDAPGFNAKGLKETFKLLEIGEIRKNGDVLYVWTHEEIQATVGSRTELRKYNWIYTIITGEKNPVIDGYSVDGYYRYAV